MKSREKNQLKMVQMEASDKIKIDCEDRRRRGAWFPAYLGKICRRRGDDIWICSGTMLFIIGGQKNGFGPCTSFMAIIALVVVFKFSI